MDQAREAFLRSVSSDTFTALTVVLGIFMKGRDHLEGLGVNGKIILTL
jgi:hypothetical protein